MKKARICLITPGHLATNPRLVKEADALCEAGHEVSVITGDYVSWARGMDLDVAAGRSWRVAAAVPFGPSAPRLLRLRQILRQRCARLAMTLGLWKQSVVESAWHPAVRELVDASRGIEADLYIAHYPAALPAAAIAARIHGSCYAFDAEDFHLGDPPEGKEWDRQRRMTRAIEGRYLPGAAYVTAASPGIADAYVDAYGIARPTVVLNVFPLPQAPAGPTPRGSAEPAPSVYWFSQTIGPDRGLECAVRATAAARSQPHLYLRGTPATGFLERLRSIAADAGVADRLHILPPAAPAAMEKLAAVYDVGLVGETGHTLNRRIALTNKVFTYLLAGLPAVLSDIRAHRSLAQELGDAARLYAVDDFEALAARLDDLLYDQAKLAQARAAAHRLGRKRFNWEREQTELLEIVKGALDGDAPVPHVASLRETAAAARGNQ